MTRRFNHFCDPRLFALYLDALVDTQPALAAARALLGERGSPFGTDPPYSLACLRVSIDIVENLTKLEARGCLIASRKSC